MRRLVAEIQRFVMTAQFVCAYFQVAREAERAIKELLAIGIEPSAITRVGLHKAGTLKSDVNATLQLVTDIVGRAAIGVGLGIVFGVAVVAILGVGPLTSIGISNGLPILDGMFTGAVTGGIAGGLAGWLDNHACRRRRAAEKGGSLSRGEDVIVVVSSSDGPHTAIKARKILDRAGESACWMPDQAALPGRTERTARTSC